jgi:dephospho-CoA kinase
MKPVIALVGGVASGKSAVAREFEKLGALVIDADREGHDVLLDASVKEEVRKAFGAPVFSGEEIDRKKLGAEVFTNAAKLATLNAITHPRIRQRTQAKFEAGLNDPQIQAIVLDISLLLESGAYEGKYSLLVFVEADEASRIERAASSRGWHPGEIGRRQAGQLSLSEKKQRAHVVIDNSGAQQMLERQVKDIWQRYVQRPSGAA